MSRESTKYDLNNFLDTYTVTRHKTQISSEDKRNKQDIAAESNEYDLETFLDAYKPLCPANTTRKSSKNILNFQKHIFEEAQLTNNPLSYMRREKNNKKKERQCCSKMVLHETSENNDVTFKRRDSGYSSHSSYAQHEHHDKHDDTLSHDHSECSQEEDMSHAKKTKNNDSKDNSHNIESKSASSKLKHLKKKFRKNSQEKSESKETDKNNNNNVWKRAKTHASKLKIRFSKQEEKIIGGASPLIENTPKIIRHKKRNNQAGERSFATRQNSFNRQSFRRNSYTGKKRVSNLKFEDNFTPPKFASKRDSIRQKSRRRPRSLYSTSELNLPIQVPVEENSVNGIFDEKYLNQSCEDLLFENDDSSVADIFLDGGDVDVFLDTDTNFEKFNEIDFDQFNLEHEDNDVIDNDVIEDNFDDDHDVIQNEVEKYYEATTEENNQRFFLKSTAI